MAADPRDQRADWSLLFLEESKLLRIFFLTYHTFSGLGLTPRDEAVLRFSVDVAGRTCTGSAVLEAVGLRLFHEPVAVRART